MRHKVAELEGALLDAAVALAEGKAWRFEQVNGEPLCCTQAGSGAYTMWCGFEPSVAWSQGGRIIERERITVVAFTGGHGEPLRWFAQVGAFAHYIDEQLPGYQGDRCGPTPLVAAMRAYVGLKFGVTVEIP
jgi:hypothetical protein